MDFNQLTVFYQVYITKSFSLAAKNLYLTQPTVSAHINILEEKLNTKLFDRTTKLVHPTEAADLLFSYVENILKQRDEIFDIFSQKYGNHNIIKFGSSTIPSKYILQSYISGFEKYNANIKFEQTISDTNNIIDMILNGKFNIGFVGSKIETDHIDFIPFHEDNLVFVTPKNELYKKIIRNKNPIKNLLKCPIISRLNTSGTKKNASTFLESLGYDDSKLNVIDYINDQEEIYKRVARGDGISLFSKIAAKVYKENGNILVYNPISRPLKKYLYIAINKNTPLTSFERKFIDFILIHK